MKQILILGSLPKTQTELDFYADLAKFCLNYAEKVYSPNDTAKLNCSDEERYQIAMEKVESSDLIIAKLSKPSTGCGMEIQAACAKSIPAIVIAKDKGTISGLVKGCPSVSELIEYQTIEDLKCNLSKIMKEGKK